VGEGIVDDRPGHLSGKAAVPMRLLHDVEELTDRGIVEVAEAGEAEDRGRSVLPSRLQPKASPCE
jgi:hypothetical protein